MSNTITIDGVQYQRVPPKQRRTSTKRTTATKNTPSTVVKKVYVIPRFHFPSFTYGVVAGAVIVVALYLLHTTSGGAS